MSKHKELFLYDEIFRDTHTTADIRHSMADAQIFLLSNILPAFPGHFDPSEHCLTPPYNKAWFEWSGEWNQDELAIIQDLDTTLQVSSRYRQGVLLTTEQTETGWKVVLWPAVDKVSNLSVGMAAAWYTIELDSNGKTVKEENGKTQMVCSSIRGIPASTFNNFRSPEFQASLITPCFFALSLLHCKNIKSIEHGGPRASGIAGTTRNRRPTRKHHVLQIKPMKQVKVKAYTEDTSTDDPTLKTEYSFHFCRGHFKTYSPEKPLFGRFVGTYWWDAHARGSLDIGMTTKHYSINPPTHKDDGPLTTSNPE